MLYDSAYVFTDGVPGVPCFVAGVNAAPPSISALSDLATDRLLADGFKVLPLGASRSRHWEYIVRVVYPSDNVLAGEDLELLDRAMGMVSELSD